MSDNQNILDIGQNAEGNGPTKISAEVTASGDNKVNTMDVEDADITSGKLALTKGLSDDPNTDTKNELDNKSPRRSSSTPGSSVADFDANDILGDTDASVKNGPDDADTASAPDNDSQPANEHMIQGFTALQDGNDSVEQTEEPMEEEDEFDADIIDTAATESSNKSDSVDEVLEHSNEPECVSDIVESPSTVTPNESDLKAEENVVDRETFDEENEVVNDVEKNTVEDVNDLEDNTHEDLETNDTHEEVNDLEDDTHEEVNDLEDDTHEDLETNDTHEEVNDLEDDTHEEATDLADDIHEEANDLEDDIHEEANDLKDDIHEETNDLEDGIHEEANDLEDDIHEKVNDLENDTHEKINDLENDTLEEVNNLEDDIHDEVNDSENDTVAEMKDLENDTVEEMKDLENDIHEEVNDLEDDIHEEVNDLENDTVEKENDLENDKVGNLNEADNSQDLSEDDIVETEDNNEKAESNQGGDAFLDLSDDDIVDMASATNPDEVKEINDSEKDDEDVLLSSAVEETTEASKGEDENVDENRLLSLDEDSKISDEAENVPESRETEQITDESEAIDAADISDTDVGKDKNEPADDDVIEKEAEDEDSISNVDEDTADKKQTAESTGSDDKETTEDAESPEHGVINICGADEISDVGVDDDDIMEVPDDNNEDPEAMETDSTDVQTESTQHKSDKQADSKKAEAENEDIDHGKSVDDVEADDDGIKTAEKPEGVEDKEAENMEVDESNSDVVLVDSKSEEDKKVTESTTGKDVEKDGTANKAAKTADISLISDIKKEVSEESVQKEEKLKEAGPGDTDDSLGLKIVGVTSAVGIEDKMKTDSKPEDESDISNDLNIKISSVSGSVESDKKTEDTDKKKPLQPKSVVTPKTEGEGKKVIENRKTEKGKAEDDDVIAIREEKKPVPKPKPSKIQKCIVCKKVGKCKYNIVRNGDVKHLCDDDCFKRFRSSPTTYLKQAETSAAQDKPAKNNTTPSVPASEKTIKSIQASVNQKQTSNQAQVYKTCTVCQLMNVRTSKPFLNWQGLDFCGEECLGKFQGSLSLTCSYCSSHIQQANKAKHCWRVGSEVKHFCSPTCINDFVKRMKLCAFCNKDLVNLADSFMAPVGEKGTFKDFCSQKCLQQFEDKNNQDVEIVGMENGKSSQPPKGNFLCAVCGKLGPVKHELTLDGKSNKLCCDACFSAFQYAKKLSINPCFSCGTSCASENQSSSQFIQFEGQQKRFCSFMCVNTFRNKYKKTVTCTWCGAKKNNFDMIERVDANSKYQLFCSLNCLSLYRVNLQATSNQAVVCDQCRKYVPAQYHLTMSDASVRNFCSYGCVMQFQAQFQIPNKPSQHAQPTNQAQKQVLSTTVPAQPVTTTRSGRVVKSGITAKQLLDAGKKNTSNSNKTNTTDSFPIISNVVSLAPKGNQQQINIKSSTPVTVTNQQGNKTTTSTTTGNQTVQQQIIIQPPPPKAMKNKSLLCKPYSQTKATSCRPHTQTKETQTDGKIEPDKYLVPVPVPIYCPTPLAMYTMPSPIMIPVPVPIPVPVFIPTTKKSAASILKQIKEIQEKIPADPLEAELLMMAEAVAGKEDESSSDSEDGGDTEVTPVKEPANPPQGELGEDMLQMALRMASEMSDEPVMDLETSLEPVAVNTLPPPAPSTSEEKIAPIEDEDEYVPPGQRQTRRSRGGGSNKRPARSTPRRNAKKTKTEPMSELPDPAPSSPAPVAPPLDANFHLKYTYGVNAFKHWVMQKNSTIEQQGKSSSGKTPKTFKLDILQCTPDELNYSLCLFVKEVRKPNGEVYAVDSIYYLCLGIQQFLFENGRIDNIFTDFYYERFTDCLNELLTRYEPKLNHAGQLVCRIEEEHLWESKQLGAHSPYVLLNSLVYFNTKYFMLKTSEDHLKLSFTHIMKHWKKNLHGRGSGTGANQGRSVYLRYYCPAPQNKSETGQKKKKEEMPVYEQTENLDNPLRCPVKLYEFYLSKCPESIKNRNDTFYLVPERSCVPDSPVWYSTAMLGIDQMAKMLNRIRLVREIQEAHLHTQPIFI